MDSLVTTTWLNEALDAPDLVILDCTVYLHLTDDGYVAESGLATFEQAHIPGAGFADLNGELVNTDSELRFAVPSPEQFAAAVEALGVRDGRRVVLYDDNQSMWAARVWWMLRWIGFDDAALLDGGMRAWRDGGYTLETGPSIPQPAEPGSLTVTPRPQLIADKDEVRTAISDGTTCLIDALPSAVFRGDMQPYARPGHIPTAFNAPAASMVDRATGRFRPAKEIRAMLPDRPEARTVAY